MPKTLELTIRDGRTILHTASANVADDFARQLFDAYITYYPGAPDDGVLFLRLARGMFEGIMNNIVAARRAEQPDERPVPQFTIDGEEVREVEVEPPIEPEAQPEEVPNAE